MATSKGSKRGIDEQQLEGGGGGGGSISGTKWSSMPSLKSNASTMDDLKRPLIEPSPELLLGPGLLVPLEPLWLLV